VLLTGKQNSSRL